MSLPVFQNYASIHPAVGLLNQSQIEIWVRPTSKALSYVQKWFSIKTKLKSMEKFKWFLGVDVSKKTLDLTLLIESTLVEYRQIENTATAIKDYFKDIKRQFGCQIKECLICMEHTGIYNNTLLQVGTKMGLYMWIETAIQIKQSTGMSRIKNDKVDSHKIALYAYRFQDKARMWQPPRDVVQMLNQMSKQREKLLKVRHQLEVGGGDNERFMNKAVAKMMKEVLSKPLKEVIQAIQAIDKKIKGLIQADPYIKALTDIITSVPGVGPVTAVKMIVTTNEFKDINDPRKYACYGGIAPFERTSGISIRGKARVSKKANLSVKTILSLCATSAIVHDPQMRQYYERKVEEGKHKSSIINAVRNKLIHRVFACIKQNRPYEKNYQHTLA